MQKGGRQGGLRLRQHVNRPLMHVLFNTSTKETNKYKSIELVFSSSCQCLPLVLLNQTMHAQLNMLHIACLHSLLSANQETNDYKLIGLVFSSWFQRHVSVLSLACFFEKRVMVDLHVLYLSRLAFGSEQGLVLDQGRVRVRFRVMQRFRDRDGLGQVRLTLYTLIFGKNT